MGSLSWLFYHERLPHGVKQNARWHIREYPRTGAQQKNFAFLGQYDFFHIINKIIFRQVFY